MSEVISDRVLRVLLSSNNNLKIFIYCRTSLIWTYWGRGGCDYQTVCIMEHTLCVLFLPSNLWIMSCTENSKYPAVTNIIKIKAENLHLYWFTIWYEFECSIVIYNEPFIKPFPLD